MHRDAPRPPKVRELGRREGLERHVDLTALEGELSPQHTERKARCPDWKDVIQRLWDRGMLAKGNLTLTPKEYFRRNCWAAVEGSEPEIEATAGLIGADRMCISTDYPHFDSNFPNVSENLMKNVSRETAAQIFLGGAHLYGFGDEHFKKADAAAAAQRASRAGG